MVSTAGTPIRVHKGNKFVGEFQSSGDEKLDMETSERILREAGAQSNSPTTLQRMQSQARSFSTVAGELFQRTMHLRRESAEYVVPYVVNAAFGIEVYLKAIGSSQGVEQKRIHALVDLYDALPSIARDTISEFAPEVSVSYEFDEPVDVRSFLVGFNDAFTTWRYSYEGKADGKFIGATHALFLLELLDKSLAKFIG